MNHFSVIGYLTENPELKYTDKGTCIATLYIGVLDYTGKEFPVKFTIIGKPAEKVAENFNRGELVCAQGLIAPNEYQGKTYTQLKITDIRKLDGEGHKVKETSGHDDITTGADESSDIPF
jgi:single-stranded DNA-binding protein